LFLVILLATRLRQVGGNRRAERVWLGLASRSPPLGQIELTNLRQGALVSRFSGRGDLLGGSH